MFHARFIQYLDTNSIANQTPMTMIAMFLTCIVHLADAPEIRSMGSRGTSVNHGDGVVKKAIILSFVIDLADTPRICNITRGGTAVNQAAGVAKKAIILSFAISLRDLPWIRSTRIHTSGPQAQAPLNRTCSD